ncbi:hypothetical protein [Halomarina litorea]|uniref:hypothetical protein n=1 Tax=Halomarina litorea TaxID=2961595 RepID=UPI0020C2820E|nr:hypothetical protein [Halomarina sp. BCD28]
MSQNPQGHNSQAAAQSTAQGSQQGTQQGTAQGGQQAQGTPQQNQPNAQNQQARQPQQSTTEEVGSWFAETTVRAGVLVLGVVVLLFALGQAAGAPLLEAVGEFFAGFGVWLVVAFFALLLIVAATKSWRTVN